MSATPQAPARFNTVRLILGSAAAPLVAGLTAIVAYPPIQHIGSTAGAPTPSTTFDALVSVGIGTGMAAVVLTIGLAMPCAIWLMNRGVVPIHKALAAGLLIANVPLLLALVVGWLIDPRQNPTRFLYGPVGTVRALLLASCVGLAASTAFWVIAVAGTGPSEER